MSQIAATARRQFLMRAWLIALFTMPIPVLVEYLGWDIRLENYYYSEAIHNFPWRDVAWFKTWEHDFLQNALSFGAVLVLVALLLSIFSPQKLSPKIPPFWRQTRTLAYVLTALLSGPLLISLLKLVTARHCPWHLSLYGGQFAYVDLWSAPLFDWRNAGRCFPGSHASVGFSLLALVPLLRGRQQTAVAVFALLLGGAMGWARMMQGAHFLSHNLWSAWICWLTVLLCYGAIKPDVHTTHAQ